MALGIEQPYWLAGLIALPGLSILLRRRHGTLTSWRAAVDRHLLPHLTLGSRSPGVAQDPLQGYLAVLAIALVALADPTWQGDSGTRHLGPWLAALLVLAAAAAFRRGWLGPPPVPRRPRNQGVADQR